MNQADHVPVMVSEAIRLLDAAPPGVVMDCTFGAGGHTAALVAAGRSVVALDRDPAAVDRAQAGGIGVPVHVANFAALGGVARRESLGEAAGVLFDLGLSSMQLDSPTRGFSFRARGPLDMRMGPDAAGDAAAIVNDWPLADLVRLLRRYGQEPNAKRIAAAIVAARPVADTAELAAVVAAAVPAAVRRRRHPARRTFQALRIAVNDELDALRTGLDEAMALLCPGGRIVVIAYHSLEDRVVAHRFADGARGCVCPPDLPICGCGRSAELRLLTRRPLLPTDTEVAHNPRSRAARLRAAEKVAQ